jgi:Holin of 3TMs, for gene-transfer release
MLGIDDAIAAGSNLITTIANKIAPDANIEEQGKITAALTEMQNQYALILAQLKINEVEAANPHWFVAAARPAAMWVGVLSLFYSGLGISLLSWIASCFGLPPLQPIDSGVSTDILMGLLGLGGMRTYEKTKGVDTKGMKK